VSSIHLILSGKQFAVGESVSDSEVLVLFTDICSSWKLDNAPSVLRKRWPIAPCLMVMWARPPP
jgi:hypothetical protein